MFFLAQLLITILLAVSSSADPCEGFGSRSNSNLRNFRIVAHSPNIVAKPFELVQRWTTVVSAGWSTPFTVGRWGEDPSVTEVFDMFDGGIRGVPPDWTTAVEVKDNAMPYFVATKRAPPQPVFIWCVVSNEDVAADSLGYGFLAANGRYDAWSLCHERSTGFARVAYNVDKKKDNSDFDVKSCRAVYLRTVPV